MALSKANRRNRIKMRVRKKVSGTGTIPRLSVFRSNKEIYAQIIDDEIGKTLVSSSSRDKKLKGKKGTKSEIAVLVGKDIAEKAKTAGISKVAFDRNGYLFHGRVKSLADGAKENGLQI